MDKEGSELMAELFNRMDMEQKKNVPPDIAIRVGDFMIKNGYRLVFNKWYLQAETDIARHRAKMKLNQPKGDKNEN